MSNWRAMQRGRGNSMSRALRTLSFLLACLGHLHRPLRCNYPCPLFTLATAQHSRLPPPPPPARETTKPEALYSRNFCLVAQICSNNCVLMLSSLWLHSGLSLASICVVAILAHIASNVLNVASTWPMLPDLCRCTQFCTTLAQAGWIWLPRIHLGFNLCLATAEFPIWLQPIVARFMIQPLNIRQVG